MKASRDLRSITRLLRRGDSGADVQELQQQLARAGFDPGPADGHFGPRTETAVRAFQQAHQLLVDGIVGTETRAALASQQPGTGTNTGQPAGTRRAASLHIGLNDVNPAAYPFPVPRLSGCINDANDMVRLARSRGVSNPVQLLDAAATAQAVIDAISFAAQTLNSGDLFFITYSGHGSQIVDVTGDENDQLDETWVLWDRQLLDDELWALWSRFRPGVRIFLLSDSCHSGTVSRDLGEVDYSPAQTAEFSREIEDYLRDHLPVLVPGLGTSAVAPQRIAQQVMLEVAEPDTPTVRLLPEEQANYEAALHRNRYRDLKEQAARAAEPKCSVLLISGCQDHQTSADGQRNGLFTQRLLEVLAEGSIPNYVDLHTRIVRRMPARQQPNYFWATQPDAAFEQQPPLTV